MAKLSVSMGKLKKPKRPNVTASQKSWDSYEKRIKEYNAKTSAKEKEKARRAKIK